MGTKSDHAMSEIYIIAEAEKAPSFFRVYDSTDQEPGRRRSIAAETGRKDRKNTVTVAKSRLFGVGLRS